MLRNKTTFVAKISNFIAYLGLVQKSTVAIMSYYGKYGHYYGSCEVLLQNLSAIICAITRNKNRYYLRFLGPWSSSFEMMLSSLETKYVHTQRVWCLPRLEHKHGCDVFLVRVGGAFPRKKQRRKQLCNVFLENMGLMHFISFQVFPFIKFWWWSALRKLY